MPAQQAKVLRVGIIRNGAIVEEKVLPARQSVTIGSGPRNSLVVAGAGLPTSLTVFAWQGERYALLFARGAEGRVQSPQGESDLNALVAQGRATAQAGSYALPLRDDQRGKLVLGEATLLWQFVTPAPESPRAVLPREAKGNHFQSMDRLFVTVLLVSFLLHSGFYAVLAATDVPSQDLTLEEIPDRYAKVLIPERLPEPPKAAEKTPEPAAEVKAEPDKKPEGDKKPETAEQLAQRKAAHAAAVARAVQSKGILKVLGALGPGTGRGAVADVFGSGGGVGDVATALSGAGGVAVATDPSAGGGRKGGGQGGAASIGNLATAGGGGKAVGYGAKSDVKVSGTVSAETAEVDSADIDQGKLGAFVRARQGLIRSCYENALKRNPALKGRLRIRFTILETGGIADISVIENGMGSPEVASCITGAMRAWRTPFHPAGPVTAEFPWFFSPGG